MANTYMREVNVKINQSIEKAAAILECFSPSEQYLTVESICKQLNQPRPTVYRILYTMEQLGLIHYNQNDATYCLGIKLIQYGGLVLDRISIKKAASSSLSALHHEIGSSVLLAIVEDQRLVYVDNRSQLDGIKYTSMIGRLRDPHYGALGKIILAYKEEDEINAILHKYPLIHYTQNSIVSNEVFLERMKTARQEGYYLDIEEVIPDIIAIGVPVFNRFNDAIASCAIVGRKEFIENIGIQHCIDLLQRYCHLISKEFIDNF
jgi:IclR family KDG regulon transcriptional repressor